MGASDAVGQALEGAAWRAWLVRYGGEMGYRIAQHPWHDTPLGDPDGWPAPLLDAVALCVASRLPIPLWWGPDLGVLYNDACRDIMGPNKHPDALGRPGRSVWPETWHQAAPALTDVLAGRPPVLRQDARRIRDRGTRLEEHYFSFTHAPLAAGGASGEVGGVATVFTETTRRVLAERRLAVLNQLADTVGAQHSAEEVAEAVARLMEANAEDHPHVALFAAGVGADAGLIPLDERGRQLDADALGRRALALNRHSTAEEVDAAGAAVVLHAVPVGEPGDPEPTAVLVVQQNPLLGHDDDLEKYLRMCASIVGTALSGIRQLGAERARAEALVQLDAAKSEFLANVSHELRTPLTLVGGPLADALGDGDRPLPGVHRDRLEVAQRNLVRLTRMVDAMLDFSRMEAGQVGPQPTSFDVAALTRTLAGSFHSAMERVGLTLRVEVPDLPRDVRLDRGMYERIVLNLLSNALKYTTAGSVTLRLVEGGDGTFTVSVSDTGIGIPRDQQQAVFERFTRLPRRAGARSNEGAGIGLAMVRQLTELLGGSVALTSRVGRGSTFRVTLPFEVSAPPADEGLAVRSVTPRGADEFLADARSWLEPEAAVAHPGAGRPRLLIAEDNADMRAYLGSVFEGDYDVTAVGDGSRALEELREGCFDVLLTDVMMPALDGLGLLDRLRADPALAHLPVVMLSAPAGPQASVTGLAHGADDYVVKPFSAAELRARVASNLLRSRARLRDAAWRRAIVASLQEAVMIADADGAVVEVNEAFTRLLGWDAAGGPYAQPYPWEPEGSAGAAQRPRSVEPVETPSGSSGAAHRPPSVEPVETSSGSSGADAAAGERRLVHRDGTEVWVWAAGSDVVLPGEARTRVTTLRDVTRERAARERRAAAARVAAEFMAAADLAELLAAAVGGFAELFAGPAAVELVSGSGPCVVTADGVADDPTALPGSLGTPPAEAASPDAATDGVLLQPRGTASCRAWVRFSSPRRVGGDELIVGDLLAEAFGLAVERVLAADEFAGREENLRRAIESHRAVGQAIGVLVERHRLTPAQAFERLRRASQHRNVAVRALAARLVETGEEP